MAGSTTKKALIRRFDREHLTGYVNPATCMQAAGIELLSPDGNTSTIPYLDVKSLSFVREFESAEPERRLFNTRPKMEGLWVRLKFRDRDLLEGVMPNNLLAVEPHGFTIIPPDPYSNHQRIFVPREAVETVEVLGVIGSPLTKRKPKTESKDQIGLFDE